MRLSPAHMSTKAITRWVVVLTAIGSLMAALDTLVVSTALSTIRLDLHASIEQLEWTVHPYQPSFALLPGGGAALELAASALIVPLGLAPLSAAFPPEKRGAAMGIFPAITGIAVAAGPLVGG